jgi:hypothetical protein
LVLRKSFDDSTFSLGYCKFPNILVALVESLEEFYSYESSYHLLRHGLNSFSLVDKLEILDELESIFRPKT